jgi:hypothetical protein
MFRAGVVLLLLLAPCGASGQEPPEDDAVLALLNERSKQFLDAVTLNRIETAIKDLLAGGPLEKQAESIKTLTTKTRELEKKYGACRGVERVDARRIGKDLVLAKYLYKCENFPVVWYFTYYRDFKRTDLSPDTESWILIAVRFDTDVELLGF